MGSRQGRDGLGLPEVNSLYAANPGKFTRFCYKHATLSMEVNWLEANSELENPGPHLRAPLPSLRDHAWDLGARERLAYCQAPPTPYVRLSSPPSSGPAPRGRRAVSALAREVGGCRRGAAVAASAALESARHPHPSLSRARSPAEEAAVAARSPQPAPRVRRRAPRAPQASPW